MATEPPIQAEMQMAVSTAESAAQLALRLEQERLAALEQRINAAIAEISADSRLHPEERAKLIAQLQGALGSRNADRVQTILANVDKAYQAEVDDYYVEQAMESMAVAGMYAGDGYDYSPEGKQHIRNQLRAAYEHSPTLRNLAKEYEALPEQDKQEGKSQARQNWEAFKQLSDNPEIAEKYKEQLVLMRGLHAPSTPQGAVLIQMLKDGRDPAELQAELNKMMDQQAAVTREVIHEIFPSLDKASKDYLGKHYGNPPDARKMVEDWAKISDKERDDAYKALAKHHGHANQLTPAQQKIVHMSTVMVGSDAAQTFHAGIAMAQDKALERQLTDRNVSVEQRGELVERYMREHGMQTWDGAARDKFAREFVETLDAHPEAMGYLRNGQVKEVAALYKAEIRSEISAARGGAPTGQGEEETYSLLDTVAFVGAAKQEVETPSYVKRDPAAFAAYQEEIKSWADLGFGGGDSTTSIAAPEPTPAAESAPTLAAAAPEASAPEPAASPAVALASVDLSSVTSLTKLGVSGGIPVVEYGAPTVGGKAPGEPGVVLT